MLPRHLLDYRISASSKTEDLLTLGRLFSEVGEYASTIQQRAYTDTARMCRTRFRKIERELLRRSAIHTADDIFLPPPPSSLSPDLTSLSISELEILYRQRPHRTEARIAEGREHMTLFFEARIIAELSRRTPDSLTDRFRIDYCLLTYRNELANLSAILNLPLGNPKDCLPFDPTHTYTSAELIALLTLYQSPRTITEREILIETVDYSLNLLSATSPADLQPLANLMAHLAELQRRKTVRCPSWLPRLLTTTISRWRRSPSVPDTDMVFPLLTAALVNRTPSLERQAQRIINRCYRTLISTFDSSENLINNTQLSAHIGALYIASTCPGYITNFSIHQLARVWNILTSRFLSTIETLSIPAPVLTFQVFCLLTTANELTNFISLSYTLQCRLFSLLTQESAVIYRSVVEKTEYSVAIAV